MKKFLLKYVVAMILYTIAYHILGFANYWGTFALILGVIWVMDYENFSWTK